jgi:hypothetical protein
MTVSRHEDERGIVVTGVHSGRDVRHHDAHPSHVHSGLDRQGRRPHLLVTVAADGRHWGDRPEGGQHLGRPHVTRMDDVVHALQKPDHSGIEVPVGIGEDAHRECGRGPWLIGFATGHLDRVRLA